MMATLTAATDVAAFAGLNQGGRALAAVTLQKTPALTHVVTASCSAGTQPGTATTGTFTAAMGARTTAKSSQGGCAPEEALMALTFAKPTAASAAMALCSVARGATRAR